MSHKVTVRRSDYAAYLRYCVAIGETPFTSLQWQLRTEKDLDRSIKRWSRSLTARPLSRQIDVADDREGAWAYRRKPRRNDDAIMADVYELGLAVVRSVRPQPAAITRGADKVLSRRCRRCKTCLPAMRFTKKRGTIREVCSRCDNAARVARRKAQS